ncbi:hypothetical protein RDV89_11935 [Nocardioides zeae]|uniref:Uncharacterized protein n=1 Tax=Nocardioides imazamoxiresistens TaxID=3231893 RepID=A0ABU3PX17_9ACTN|nr:hypothetical protein [Nocardioides zeae]MDT9593782.1 hypothetical protein [Nocardioides zeae]
MSTDQPAGEQAGERVGSVGEEAAKLFGALADWARDHDLDHGGAQDNGGAGGLGGMAHGVAQGVHGLAEGLRDAAAGESPGESSGTSTEASSECRFCPVCRGIHLARQCTPEVRAQLAGAAASFMQASAALLNAVAADPRPGPARSDGVERIDLDDETPR